MFQRKCGPGWRCTNCDNVPSPRSTSETAESEVEQEELHDDLSEYNSELVDDVESESGHKQDDDLYNYLLDE